MTDLIWITPPTPSAARERIATYLATTDAFHLYYSGLADRIDGANNHADTILALLPDPAAIRAEATDEMVKAARDAKIFLNMTDEGWRKAWRVMAAKAGTRSDAAIRAAAFEEAAKIAESDEVRQSKLHELLETIREQIRLEIPPENRPENLFNNIQNAVYAMRGRPAIAAAIRAAGEK
jgi:hypothetical protein